MARRTALHRRERLLIQGVGVVYYCLWFLYGHTHHLPFWFELGWGVLGMFAIAYAGGFTMGLLDAGVLGRREEGE